MGSTGAHEALTPDSGGQHRYRISAPLLLAAAAAGRRIVCPLHWLHHLSIPLCGPEETPGCLRATSTPRSTLLTDPPGLVYLLVQVGAEPKRPQPAIIFLARIFCLEDYALHHHFCLEIYYLIIRKISENWLFIRTDTAESIKRN